MSIIHIMRVVCYTVILAILFLTPVTGICQDVVYPTGFNVISSRSLSQDSIAIGGTLTLVTTLTNNESFNLNNLYFSENTAACLSVVSYRVTIDGTEVPCLFESSSDGFLVPGFVYHTWTVDCPDPEGEPQQPIEPGAHVELEVNLMCSELGVFSFPQRTTVFSSDNQSFFAIGDTDEVTVVVSVDVEEQDTADDVLPRDYLTVRAYPNPFNGQVTIVCTSGNVGGETVRFEIFNVLGQRVYDTQSKLSSGDNYLSWTPPENISTGIYFFTLSSTSAKASGKLLLMK